jgi:hypothetical protein
LTEAAPAPADNAAPAPVAEAAPAPQPTTTSWRDTLPDDIKTSPSLSKFDTIEGLAKSYTNLEKMLGSDKVPVPKEGDAEGTKNFFKAAGWPEKPEEYGFKQPEKVPDGMVYNADLDTRLAGIFHDAILTKGQASNVREKLMALVAEGATANLESAKVSEADRIKAIETGTAALKQEWGQAFDQRAKVAGAAINKFLSPESVAAIEAAGLGNNPAVIKDMYALGTKLAGEKELIGEVTATAQDIDVSIADFRQKHQAALFDRAHPDHAIRTQEYTRLFERRFGE